MLGTSVRLSWETLTLSTVYPHCKLIFIKTNYFGVYSTFCSYGLRNYAIVSIFAEETCLWFYKQENQEISISVQPSVIPDDTEKCKSSFTNLHSFFHSGTHCQDASLRIECGLGSDITLIRYNCTVFLNRCHDQLNTNEFSTKGRYKGASIKVWWWFRPLCTV